MRDSLSSDFNLTYWAAKMPEKPAVIMENCSLSYAEIDKKSNSLAADLKNRGLKEYDVLLMYMANSPEFALIFHAAVKLNLNIVFANPLFKVCELTQLIQNTSPAFAFIDNDEHQKLVEKIRQGIPTVNLSRDHDMFNRMVSGNLPGIENTAEKPASTIVCTSGSTGKLKFVARSFQNQTIPALSLAEHMHADAQDVFLIPLPLTQQYGLIAMLTSCLCGGTAVIMKSFQAASALKLIDTYKVSVQFGVPSMFSMEIEEYSITKDKSNLHSLRTGMISGASSSTCYYRWFEENFGCRLLESYGTTEIAAITMTDFEDSSEIRYSSCGKPFEYVHLRIVDEDGKDLPAGEAGEILCSTPCRMSAYIGDPDQTIAAFSDGWFRTGDIGVMDENGRLTIRGRKKDMIIRGGYNIYPAEIEKLLMRYPDVVETCVIGKKDRRLGERTCAFVAFGNHVTESEETLRQYVGKHIAKYKIPDHIVFMDTLPKLQNGKVDKCSLQTIANQLQL